MFFFILCCNIWKPLRCPQLLFTGIEDCRIARLGQLIFSHWLKMLSLAELIPVRPDLFFSSFLSFSLCYSWVHLSLTPFIPSLVPSLSFSMASQRMNNSQPPAAKSCFCPTLALPVSSFDYWWEFSFMAFFCLSVCFSLRLFFSLSRHMPLLSPCPPLCFSLVLWQVVVRLCKLNSENWAVALHHTAALKDLRCQTRTRGSHALSCEVIVLTC